MPTPTTHPDGQPRCGWCPDEPLYRIYHDEEWGLPVRDDRRLFEMLLLEGAQAGLSWSTILRKREGYRRAFADFDAEAIAAFTEEDQERLRQDAGIVRNRAKIAAAVANARAFLQVRLEFGTFSDYIWSFTEGTTIQNSRRSLADLPAQTPESQEMSRDLRRRGFKFVGPTICYAFMQAVGMVNDHEVGCFRYAELTRGG